MMETALPILPDPDITPGGRGRARAQGARTSPTRMARGGA